MFCSSYTSYNLLCTAFRVSFILYLNLRWEVLLICKTCGYLLLRERYFPLNKETCAKCEKFLLVILL